MAATDAVYTKRLLITVKKKPLFFLNKGFFFTAAYAFAVIAASINSV